ncbi:hypothetical protein Lepto7375DRAFT_0451 [Leptolyngbya sp. PCC 7375]|nr:hypothetical protein Lepto7375DRAFT_0451 [Leptolyngbya sp. PCC 7375]
MPGGKLGVSKKMKYDEFIKHVQSFSQVESLDEVKRAVRATLQTLAERVPGHEASKLAEQLPREMATHFQGREGQPGNAFSLKEFYRRVSDREHIDPAAAVVHVRAVFAVLNSAIVPADFGEVQATLTEDYEELFAAPSFNVPGIRRINS